MGLGSRLRARKRLAVLVAASVVAATAACSTSPLPPTPKATSLPAVTTPASGPTATPSHAGASATPSQSRPARTTGSPTPSKSADRVAVLPAGLVGRDLEAIPTTRRVVALTFDAGSDAAGVAPILATLRRTGAVATFFLTGVFVDRYPALARQIAAGYRVGDHTQGHPDLTTLPDAEVIAEIQTAAAHIRATTGADPRPWFRFPFGARNARTIADANRLGYACIRWTVDSLGWQGTSGGRSVTSVRDKVLAAARPGAIVLMHVGANPDDHTTLDADALPSVIAGLTARGYTTVTLDALLG